MSYRRFSTKNIFAVKAEGLTLVEFQVIIDRRDDANGFISFEIWPNGQNKSKVQMSYYPRLGKFSSPDGTNLIEWTKSWCNNIQLVIHILTQLALFFHSKNNQGQTIVKGGSSNGTTKHYS